MRRTVAFLMALIAISQANPILEYFLSEIQVAPDSLERIEIHMYSHERSYPVDLSGWTVTTNGGSATIDSGIVLQGPTDFAVITHENVSGTFTLGDSSDDIWLEGASLAEDRYLYGGGQNWTPPYGMSVAAFITTGMAGPEEYLPRVWYIDSTPTFGWPNDDFGGRISGRVLDRFGRPLEYCDVLFEAAQGTGNTSCDSTGRYVMSPLGPGTYRVSAHSDSTYLPIYYPESVSIGVNGLRDSVNMTMYPVGVSEHRETVPFAVLHQRGRTLVLNADRAGIGVVTVYDNLGRVRMSEKVALVEGKNELAMPSLSSGVYFATAHKGTSRSTVKVVFW